MCGLISVIGKITSKEERIFKQGLIVDTLRGEHSTGVAVTRRGKNGETFIAKQVGNPFELFNDKRFDKAMGGWNRVLIGHNRYATQGSVNRYNAHPFEFWPVYGAHNGTLSERAQLVDNSKFSVDSQALYNHISAHGLEDAITKVRGAWALTWWNEEDQTFNVLRNKERTLYTTKDKESDVRYFCSEAEMLILILNRNGVKYDKITIVPEDTWLSFEIGPEGEVAKPRSKVVKGKEAPPPVVHGNNRYYSGNNNSARGPVQNPSSQAATQTVKGFNTAVLRKEVLMALIDRKVDKDDNEYFVIRDVEFPLADVRMYPITGSREPFPFKEGDVIVGQIFHFSSKPDYHYRVSVTNSRLANTEQQIEYDEKEAKLFVDGTLQAATEEEEKQEEGEKAPQFYDHRGRLLSKADWKKEYPHCDWCTQDVDPDEEGTFLSKAGSVLCPSCAKDKEVLQYVHD